MPATADNPDAMFQTAADHAYHVIREKILSGEFKPGQKLSRRGMAAETKVSVIPVIEALHRLENDGLVESQPRWGSRVLRLDDRQVRDFTCLREAVECQAVRMLAGRLDAVQENTLRTLAAEIDQKYMSAREDPKLWEVHYQFHLNLVVYTGCDSLVAALKRCHLFNLVQKATQRAGSKTKRLPPDWHLRIVDALVAGDPRRAHDIMEGHVRDSLDPQDQKAAR